MERPPVYTILHVNHPRRSTRIHPVNTHSGYYYEEEEFVNILEEEEGLTQVCLVASSQVLRNVSALCPSC